ncbi:MAG: ATP-binding cassette domain-containing protein [Candidatus Kapabacteria bacterium]|nr:ATP-binding cassette domain-containing protein [Candidatus Kapabacteria bacterium]
MLTITNISKRFGAMLANDHISLNVRGGSIYGLLGPNGAGKTTLIRMITNIIMPDEGEILLDGLPVSAVQQNTIGYLPEERGLYKKLTVAEQLTYFGQLKGLDGREAIKRGLWWLSRMDAAGWESKKVQELSKGMQQKVQFISTILHEPKLVILDEPFSGLDPLNSDLLISVIKELQERGTTIILSTHQMDQVERLCDDIALINHGAVVLEGSVREVRAGFRSDRVYVDYHGQDALMRAVPGTSVVDSAAGRVELRIDDETVRPTDVLRYALANVEITRFEVAEPSLHDIFVQTVTGHVTMTSTL